jgi:hypothetical protein
MLIPLLQGKAAYIRPKAGATCTKLPFYMICCPNDNNFGMEGIIAKAEVISFQYTSTYHLKNP